MMSTTTQIARRWSRQTLQTSAQAIQGHLQREQDEYHVAQSMLDEFKRIEADALIILDGAVNILMEKMETHLVAQLTPYLYEKDLTTIRDYCEAAREDAKHDLSASISEAILEATHTVATEAEDFIEEHEIAEEREIKRQQQSDYNHAVMGAGQ